MTGFRGFVRDLVGLPPPAAAKDPVYDHDGDCKINALGAEWLAQFTFTASPDEGSYVVTIETCSLVPSNQRLHCEPIPVDYSELPQDCQDDIEDAALRGCFERERPTYDDDSAG